VTFEEVIASRNSKRDFLPRDVPDELLNRLLEAALSAPSSSNTQAYRVAIAKGEVREALSQKLTEKFQRASRIKRKSLPGKILGGLFGGVLPNGDFKPDINYPPELKQRAFECGKGLYDTLGIARKDYAARDKQMQRNFCFFYAPVELFLFVHGDRGAYSALDGGIFLQTLMLAATNAGLGTCAQASVAVWGGTVREYFNVDPDYKLICGLSLGYPSEHKVNRFQPEKRDISEILFSPRP